MLGTECHFLVCFKNILLSKTCWRGTNRQSLGHDSMFTSVTNMWRVCSVAWHCRNLYSYNTLPISTAAFAGIRTVKPPHIYYVMETFTLRCNISSTCHVVGKGKKLCTCISKCPSVTSYNTYIHLGTEGALFIPQLHQKLPVQLNHLQLTSERKILINFSPSFMQAEFLKQDLIELV